MNERGFFSVVGLCLLLVITLSIMAIQETEKNYSYLASDFQEEFELQSAAESGLIEAAEKIIQEEIIVTPPSDVERIQKRNYWQRQISVSQPDKSDQFKNISVEVYGENGDIYQGTRKYSSGGTITDTIEKDDSGKEITKKGIVLISVASGENNAGVKKFRRAFAYILEKNDVSDGEGKYYKQIYFMNTLSSNE